MSSNAIVYTWQIFTSCDSRAQIGTSCDSRAQIGTSCDPGHKLGRPWRLNRIIQPNQTKPCKTIPNQTLPFHPIELPLSLAGHAWSFLHPSGHRQTIELVGSKYSSLHPGCGGGGGGGGEDKKQRYRRRNCERGGGADTFCRFLALKPGPKQCTLSTNPIPYSAAHFGSSGRDRPALDRPGQRLL